MFQAQLSFSCKTFFFISQMKIHRPRGRKASWVTLSAHQPISVQGRFLSSLCTLDVILSQEGSLKFVFHCFQEFVICPNLPGTR